MMQCYSRHLAVGNSVLMLSTAILTALIFTSATVSSQESAILWSKTHQFSLQDFQFGNLSISQANKTLMLQSATTVEIGFAMNGVQFMFTKNFNDKVKTKFVPSSTLLIATDSTSAKQLIKLADFDFDLSELYARKLRKKLFENKKTFSKAYFFERYFNDLMKERNEKSAEVYRLTEFGANKAVLREEHSAVAAGLAQLSEFCFGCKPSKKRKNPR